MHTFVGAMWIMAVESASTAERRGSFVLIKDMAARDARDALAAYWPEGTVPVDPFVIAERMGIRARQMVLDDDTSGILVAQPQTQSQIYVELTDTYPRQRFTVAHELGHFVERTQTQKNLDDGFSFVDKRTSKRDAHEFYADEFAGSLLMPEDEVRWAHQQGFSVIAMAGHFEVSVPAMQTRLRRLKLDSAVGR